VAYRNVQRHPEAITFPGLLILRIGGDLFFASVGHVSEALKASLAARPDVKRVLLDFGPVNLIETYFALTVSLLLVSLQKLNLDGPVRARVAIITGLAILGYVLRLYLIFFLTYTPLDVDHVRGVQGRYFVIALPMASVFLASMTNIDLPRGALATTAITGSLLSGITSFKALLGAHWSVP
jgi:uncharacterized membrane protein